MQFFTKHTNYKGTMSFGVGFFLVVIGWPILGMILEAYGFIILFSGFWPTLAVFLQKIPILGWLLQYSFLRSVTYTVGRDLHYRRSIVAKTLHLITTPVIFQQVNYDKAVIDLVRSEWADILSSYIE